MSALLALLFLFFYNFTYRCHMQKIFMHTLILTCNKIEMWKFSATQKQHNSAVIYIILS